MEFSKVIIGKGEYGIPASAVEYAEGLPVYIRITDISDDGFFMPDPKVSFDHSNYNNYQKYKLKYGDIVFARTGNSTGRNYLYNNEDGELYYAGFLIKYKLDTTKVLPEFIGLYCKSYKYRNWIESVSKDGSTRKKMNAQDYLKMPIPNLSISQQNKVVKKILPLEEKILLNLKIIKYLEEYSQLLFHKWFIDFNFPNKEGKPHKVSGGEMVEVDGKIIPNGWRIKKFGDLVSFKNGLNYAADDTKVANAKIISVKQLVRNNILSENIADELYISDKTSSDYLIKKYDTIIARSASPGESALALNDLNVYYSGFSIRIRPNNEMWRFLTYFTTLKLKKIITSHSDGTIIKNITQQSMSNFNIIIPEDITIHRFNELIEPILLKTQSLLKENIVLEETRDLLIKKLIK